MPSRRPIRPEEVRAPFYVPAARRTHQVTSNSAKRFAWVTYYTHHWRSWQGENLLLGKKNPQRAGRLQVGHTAGKLKNDSSSGKSFSNCRSRIVVAPPPTEAVERLPRLSPTLGPVDRLGALFDFLVVALANLLENPSCAPNTVDATPADRSRSLPPSPDSRRLQPEPSACPAGRAGRDPGVPNCRCGGVPRHGGRPSQ